MYMYVILIIRKVMSMRESGGAQEVMNERTGRGWDGDDIDTVIIYGIFKNVKKMENSLGKETDCFWIEFGKLKVFSVFTKL